MLTFLKWIWIVIGAITFIYFVMMVIVTMAPLSKLTCLKDDDITIRNRVDMDKSYNPEEGEE